MSAAYLKEIEERMKKTLVSLDTAFARIRTGRAHPSILDSVQVSYYGSMMPLNQVANVIVEDARTLTISPWERKMLLEIELRILFQTKAPAKAIQYVRCHLIDSNRTSTFAFGLAAHPIGYDQ